MAWLEKRGDQYHIGFRFAGQKFKKSLGTSNPKEAQSLIDRVERRISLVEQGDLEIPPDADWLAFLISDGKKTQSTTTILAATFGDLCDRYLQSINPASLEENSHSTLRIHVAHLRRILGDRLPVAALNFAALQRYVDTRGCEKGHRKKHVSPITIRKELASLSGVWSWALRMGLLKQAFPNRGLRFAKMDEKPPFQTWAEIERRVAQGGLTDDEQATLWDALYLTTEEIKDVLRFVRGDTKRLMAYPMLLFAAHTGARRSEIIRSQVSDFDFTTGHVLIHEKKRIRGQRSTRTVPMTLDMQITFRDWIENRRGRWCFALQGEPLTPKNATDLFEATFVNSRWKKLRGWHVFRHSFISNCASKGVDQRMIDAWVGHTTEEMRRRYRHLLPDAQQAALASVFGGK